MNYTFLEQQYLHVYCGGDEEIIKFLWFMKIRCNFFLNSDIFKIQRNIWNEDVIKIELRTRIHEYVSWIERIQEIIKR
jgi:hypothetical protein